MNYPKADLIKYRLERAEEVLKEAEVMAKWNIGDRAFCILSKLFECSFIILRPIFFKTYWSESIF